ncbi:ATP-grasp domain-containing protein [Nonomuraea sp. NPDC049709]|uniref:preATP grasp domain-containing protein n=1 Tax=Nonomuraea sp. NPDC049709 TaxID=3154736 RepID=UPI003419B698
MFLKRVKTALTGSPDTPLAFVGNFEVEDQWAVGEQGLPRLGFSAGAAIVNRMDEFTLLLAGPDDHVILKEPPDQDYLAHLAELGVALPRVHTVARNDPRRTVTLDALDDPELMETLSALEGVRLAPHGTSMLEEQLSAVTGLPLVTPRAAVCKSVNSKIYSRRAADDAGLRQVAGWTAGTMAELEAVLDEALTLLEHGRSLVIKDAFGVSGKGIVVVEDRQKLERLHAMILRRADKSGDDTVALVIEEWVAKSADLNYQFTVSPDASAHFDFVKEAITDNGVHKGHRIPATLTAEQVAELEEASHRLAKTLAGDGFYGVVGVDAMVDTSGRLYPVVEINARNNMSTYQLPLQERFMAPGQVALARQYPLRLSERLPYRVLRRKLAGLLLEGPGGAGLLVNNFATVNAAAGESSSFDGRLYGLLIADGHDARTVLDHEIMRRLA